MFTKILRGTALLAVVVFLITMISSSVTVYAASPTFSVPINLSNDNFRAKDPNVQNSGSNVYVAWTEGSHGIWFRTSPDNGVTWSPSLRISSTGGTTQFPLISESGSFVYIVWSQSVGGVLQMMFASSANNGATFSTPKDIDGSTTIAAVTPAIAASGNDVYVVYNGGGHSFVTASSNNGATWTIPFQYASGPEPQVAASGTSAYAIADTFSRSATAIAVTHDNGVSWTKSGSGGGAEPWIAASGTNVIAAWESKGNASTVHVITSTNSGTTFTKPVLLSSTVPNSWSPMVNVTGNTEYVAWRSNPGSSNSQEYVSTSTDAGTSWSTPVAIGVAGRDNSWPFTIAASGTNVFIMWNEKANTKSSSSDWQTLVSYSGDSGSTWSLSILTSNPASGAASENDVATGAMSAFSTNGFSVWQNNATTPQIYFSAS